MLQTCDKSGSGRAAEVTLQLCGLWNAPVIRGSGGLEKLECRWSLWTRTRQRKLGASPEKTAKGESDESEKTRSDRFQRSGARAHCARKTHRIRAWTVALISNFIVLRLALRNSGARSQ